MRVKDPLCGTLIDSSNAKFQLDLRGKTYFFCSEYCQHHFAHRPTVAYFSMEVGIQSDIPTYSGGLGVLAGDVIRSCADLRVPLVAVTLSSRKGYLHQTLTETGKQLEQPELWDPADSMHLLPSTVTVRIGDRDVEVRAWVHEYPSPTGGIVPILFLDTNVPGNTVEDRGITDYLYGGDARYRLKQEVVLGIAGCRMLTAAKFNVINFHMNEGHSSLLTLELLKRYAMDEEQVRNVCIFTTHTPVESAIDRFSYDLVRDTLGEADASTLSRFGGSKQLNLTQLALNLSKYVNGVTKAHMEYSNQLYPGHHIRAITNGVHSYTWTCPSFQALYDKYIPGWANEPELLVRVDEIPEEDVWDSHMEAKQDLLAFTSRNTGVPLDPSALTIGFARRATEYKRATLIFSDEARLVDAVEPGSIQCIFAGKAHPRDIGGKRLIEDIFGYQRRLRDHVPIAYLENYDLEIGKQLVAGVDVWLNTPLPPYEASGTSGMKAAHNGVLNFSVLDGWWLEGCIEGVTGWSIGPPGNEPIDDRVRRAKELKDLYAKLEYVILPTFLDRRDAWITMMKNAIGKIANYFNTHRMMRRYIAEAYLF